MIDNESSYDDHGDHAEQVAYYWQDYFRHLKKESETSEYAKMSNFHKLPAYESLNTTR